MMRENRINYLLITLIIIVIGLFSRKITFVPFFVGDVLYAVMVYFGIRFLHRKLSKIKSGIIALLICYCIELLQLYDSEWIIAVRDTLLGRYVLGQGFLWSDILAYTFGIAIAHYLDTTIVKGSRT